MRDPKDIPDPEVFARLSADEQGYHQLAIWLKSTTGIHMPPTPKNLTLMAARLSRIMGSLHLRGYSELYRQLQKGEPELVKACVEALTTNKTEFFREAHHFEVLPRILPELLQRKRELRVWCAASSRGHEPYSILFTLLEAGLDQTGQTLRFLASDIDQTVLEAASKGVYRREELAEVPQLFRERYMVKLRATDAGERWKVRDELRSRISFARLNLVEFPYPFQHKFDIIFCRNVLIYFDRETAQMVKAHLAQALAANGCLFIGHSETGSGRIPGLESVEAAVFRKTPA